MIKVVIKRKKQEIHKIEIQGHADYADLGKDIVCAGVSASVITSINAILKFDKTSIEVKQEKNKTDITVKKFTSLVQALLENLEESLNDIAQSYPNHVQMRKEEENE